MHGDRNDLDIDLSYKRMDLFRFQNATGISIRLPNVRNDDR